MSADVRVRRSENVRQLEVDGLCVSDTGPRLFGETGLAYFPRMLRPCASRVLVIGFGSGTACGASLLFPQTKVVCVEDEPAIVAAAGLFEDVNHQPGRSGSFSLLIREARMAIQSHSNAFDLILVNYGDARLCGIRRLWTKEFYVSARRALSPGGMLVERLALGSIPPSDLTAVARTVLAVFPYSGMLRISDAEVLLLASATPLIESSNSVHQAQALIDHLPAVHSELRQYFGSAAVPTLLLTRFWLDEGGLRFLAGSDDERNLLTDWTWRLRLPGPRGSFDVRESQTLVGDLLAISTTPAAFEHWSKLSGCSDQEAAAACHQIGSLFEANGQPRQALKVLKWGLGFDPAQPELLADQLLWSNEEDSNTVEETVSVIEKRSVAAAYRVAVGLSQRRQTKLAILVLTRLTKISSESATVWASLASCHQAAGDLKRAQECLDKAQALDPANGFVQRLRQERIEGRSGP